jgi:hypothetical protein
MNNIHCYRVHWIKIKFYTNYRSSVDKDVPLPLVVAEELSTGLELDDALPAGDLPGGALQLEVDIDALVLGGPAESDLTQKN